MMRIISPRHHHLEALSFEGVLFMELNCMSDSTALEEVCAPAEPLTTDLKEGDDAGKPDRRDAEFGPSSPSASLLSDVRRLTVQGLAARGARSGIEFLSAPESASMEYFCMER